MVRKLNDTWYLCGNPPGKNHGLISELHSNLESIKCEKDYNLIPEVITHLPNPGMSEPSPIACDLRNLISEATKVLLLKEEITSLCEYMNTQNAIRARQPYMLI